MLHELLVIPTILAAIQVSVVHCCNLNVLKARATILAAVPGSTPQRVIGNIDFVQIGNLVTITGTVTGLTPGLHGFHVHEKGNLGNGCADAGGHYNPLNMDHGAPYDYVRHVGDLGNIFTPNSGITTISIRDSVIRLDGPYSIVGRALVIHSDADDLGRGNSPLSKTTGNSGSRVACGVIVSIPSLLSTTHS